MSEKNGEKQTNWASIAICMLPMKSGIDPLRLRETAETKPIDVTF